MKRIAVALCFLLIFGSLQVRAKAEPQLIVLSIGQGAAVLLQHGSTQILYDTGPDGGILEGLGRHVPIWDTTLELVVLSHLHTDHIGGADEVFDRFKIGELWWNDAASNSPATLALRASLPPSRRTPSAGHTQSVGAFTLEVLHPPEEVAGMTLSHAHDGTLVVRARVEGRSALLTGDLEANHVRSLVAGCAHPCAKVQADVLMLSHHGSRNATSAALLDAVAPSLAFVCVGKKNRYRHPHPEPLELLSARSIPLHRTDLHGDLVVVFRPSGIVWQRSTGPPL